MSAISGFINTIRNAVYGEQVRGAIISALEACYSDVESPSLNQAAFTAAIEAAYAGGILDIITVTQISAMTNQNIIYRYNGTEAGKQKGLYYYSALSSSWVLIGSEIHSVSLMSRMTDTNSLYKYTGTETGKQKGIYYHNGTEWEYLGGGVQAGTLDDMTNTKMLYRYTGTNPAMIRNALYYYNGTAWVPIGQAKSGTESLQTLSIVPNWNRGALSEVGRIIANNSWAVTKTAIPVTEGTVISAEENSGIVFGVARYSKNDVFIDFIKRSTDGLDSVTVPSDCLIRINATYSPSTTLEDEMSAAELGSLISIETQMDIVFQDAVCEMEIGDCTVNDGLPLQTKDYNVQRSKKILKTNNQKIVKLTFDPDLVANRRNIYITLYNKNGVSMGNANLYRSRSRKPEQTLILPNGVYYIKIVMSWNEANYKTLPIIVSAQEKVTECFNPFPVSVIQKVSYPVTTKYQTAGQLMMPPNYSFDGEPVPLIVCAHGSDMYASYTSGVAGLSQPIWNYFKNEGFAVFDCFPWTTKYDFIDDYPNNMYSPYVTPSNLLSYLNGIEWVCSRYNVDINRVYCCCISQGGQLGMWAMMREDTPFKAISLLSPGSNVVQFAYSAIYIGESGRAAMQEIQQFEGTDEEIEAFITDARGWQDPDIVDFCRKNMDKIVPTVPWAQGICGLTASEIFELSFSTADTIPQWLIDKGAPSTYGETPAAFINKSDLSKHAFVPTKFWGAYDDAAVAMHNLFAIYQWLLNGGSDTAFRVLPNGTGGHYAALSFTSPDTLKTSGTTALGIAYTNVPVAIVETVEFFRKKTIED